MNKANLFVRFFGPHVFMNFSEWMRCRSGMIFLLICLSLVSRKAGAEPLDHIAAAVNNEVITASELDLAVAFNTHFGAAGTYPREIEAETLDGLINRRLLIQEARRLKFVELSDQDLTNEIKTLGTRFGSEKALHDFLEELDVTPQELAHMLGERLLVERFIEKKIGLFARVSSEEVKQYFESHPADFRGKRLQNVQKDITALLTERKIVQHADNYVAELRAKANIRINPTEYGRQ